MEPLDVRELSARLLDILRRVRDEGASYAIVDERGDVLARLTPDLDELARRARARRAAKAMKRLAAEISEELQPGPGAVELIREARDRLEHVER